MEVKECRKCHKAKPLTDFHKFSKSKDGKQTRCKTCANAAASEWYAKNQEKFWASHGKRKSECRDYIWNHLSSNQCVDCGTDNPLVLEFDHRSPTEKRFEVSKGLEGAYCLDTVKAEIDKCDVRCANCHRKRTAEQFGWMQPKS
jgi:protein-arginine kinase activator protein McsA